MTSFSCFMSIKAGLAHCWFLSSLNSHSLKAAKPWERLRLGWVRLRCCGVPHNIVCFAINTWLADWNFSLLTLLSEHGRGNRTSSSSRLQNRCGGRFIFIGSYVSISMSLKHICSRLWRSNWKTRMCFRQQQRRVRFAVAFRSRSEHGCLL